MKAGWELRRLGRCLPYPLKLLLFLLALWATSADAQTPDTDVDPDPLRPADTSSPRATLHSFLNNTNAAIDNRRQGEMTAAGYRNWRRAMQTMDFRNTPDGDTWSVRTERLLLLHEVLGRIDLPPDDEIPGDREVAKGNITTWRIPGTSIRIAEVEHGVRAGEFLFSATTVERIGRLYRQASHLPYTSEAMSGFYEAYVQLDRTELAHQAQYRNRLRPVDSSSPRSTFVGFLESVNRAYSLVKEAEASLNANPPTITKEEAFEIEREAQNLLRRAMTTLDMSNVPRAHRQDHGMAAVLQLKEVFDRSLLPPLDSVPSGQMVAVAREQGSLHFAVGAEGLRWRVPNTEIDIVEITEGPRQGEFLFSAGTVRRIGEYYRRIRDLRYRPESFGGTERTYRSPDLSPGFYEFYVSTPGFLIPSANPVAAAIDQLPASLKALRGGQTAWQWIAFVVCVLAVAVLAYVLFRALRRMAARHEEPLKHWLLIVAPVVLAFIVAGVTAFIDDDLNITGDTAVAVRGAGNGLFVILTAWATFGICTAFAETIIATPRVRDPSPEASLLRIGASIIGVFIALWIGIGGLQDLGADLIPLLAGLGVGGLAIALAAQKTIANFIGSLILFVNKPVKVGDFCRYGDEIGTVEHIGWISTRIRSLERTIITVPNAEFSEMKLDNFTARDQRLLRTTLQLRYETTPDQMRYILVELRELLLGHPMVTPEPARVRFVGYGDYSKNLEIFAYLRCQDQNTFLAMQEDVLLRMEDIIVKAGSGFAFPSQTAYLARDGGLNAEHRDRAEFETQNLRTRGKLPFPEFDEEERERLEDTLDYPPKGSPDFEPRVGQPEPLPPKQ